MRREEQDIKEVFRQSFPEPSEEQVNSSCSRVLSRLRTTAYLSEYVTDESESNRFEHSSSLIVAAILAAVLLAAIPLVRTYVSNSKVYAIVEKDGGSSYRLGAGQIVKTDVWTGAMLTLSDSSSVEMRSGSELLLERASDGLRIRLNKGSVIVHAAKQRDSHLYVQTKDVTVSVVGTVFLVSSEETGSRVAVLEGEVHVQQGATARRLLPGQQFATNGSMELLTLAEQFAWSRQRAEYIAKLESPKPFVPAKQNEKSPEPARVLPQATVAGNRPQFEVASIKRNNNGERRFFVGGTTGRYTATNVTVRQLIQLAYKVQPFQISGEPNWINSERYDIEAKADLSTSRQEIIGPLLQALIEDRFKLKIHGETKESPVYFLTVAKGGPKLKAGSCMTRDPGAPVVPGQRQSAFCGFMGIGDDTLLATSTTAEALANELSGILERRVLDRTAYMSAFDVRLRWVPELNGTPTTDSGPSIFTAIEEQLGLKLESGRAPIDVLVIDHVEHPSEN